MRGEGGGGGGGNRTAGMSAGHPDRPIVGLLVRPVRPRLGVTGRICHWCGQCHSLASCHCSSALAPQHQPAARAGTERALRYDAGW